MEKKVDPRAAEELLGRMNPCLFLTDHVCPKCDRVTPEDRATALEVKVILETREFSVKYLMDRLAKGDTTKAEQMIIWFIMDDASETMMMVGEAVKMAKYPLEIILGVGVAGIKSGAVSIQQVSLDKMHEVQGTQGTIHEQKIGRYQIGAVAEGSEAADILHGKKKPTLH